MSTATTVSSRSRMPRLAGAAVERARLRVVPRRRVHAARFPFVTLVTLVLLAGVVGLLCFNTSMQQSSFAATALDQQAQNLAAREQSLQLELQQLRNPQRLAMAAQKRGMVIPTDQGTVELGTGKVLGDPAPAVAGPPLPLFAKAPAKPDFSAPTRPVERPGHVPAG